MPRVEQHDSDQVVIDGVTHFIERNELTDYGGADLTFYRISFIDPTLVAVDAIEWHGDWQEWRVSFPVSDGGMDPTADEIEQLVRSLRYALEVATFMNERPLPRPKAAVV